MCSFECEYPKASLRDFIMEKEIIHTRLLELFVSYVCINITIYKFYKILYKINFICLFD